MPVKTLRYHHDEQEFDVYLALPEGAGPHPALMVCHAWGGRDEGVESKARELAALGYVGAAIDLYGVGKRGHDKESSQALMGPLVAEPARLRARIAGAFAQVRVLAEVDSTRIAIMGYCFGGMCAHLAARMGLDLRAAVSFHGLLKLGPPLESRPQARILILHGQDDPMVSIEELAAFAAEMKRVDADWELHCYPGVMHAFTNPKANDPSFGTVYNAAADRRSWEAMMRFVTEAMNGQATTSCQPG